MTDFKDRLSQFKAGLRSAVGDAIRKPVPARLGYINAAGDVIVKVPDENTDSPDQYFFSEAGGQSLVGQAYLQPGIIAEWQLRYGTPIRIQKDPIADIWNIVGLDIQYAAEYFKNTDPEQIGIVPLRRFEPGLLTSTNPRSMRVRVSAAVYDVGTNWYYWGALTSINFADQPEMPTSGFGRFVLVQVLYETGELSYKYGDLIPASVTFDTAYQQQVASGNDNLLPMRDDNAFRAGYVKLIGDQDAIDRTRHIWSMQEVLSKGSGATNEDKAKILSSIVTAKQEGGGVVISSSGNVIYTKGDYSK